MGTAVNPNCNQKSTMVYPNGETVATSYNTQGLPVTLTGSDAYVTNAAYNAQGQMTQLVRGGNAVTTAYDYFDAAGNFRLEAIRHGAANDALPDFSYQYDAVGNITQMTAVTGSDTDSQSFSYDALNRLLTASADAASPAPYSESYDYDAMGNILSRNGASYSYTPAASRTYTHTQPHAVTGIGSDQSFNYDANGNMTFRQDGTGSFIQHWDVENRLTAVQQTEIILQPGAEGMDTYIDQSYPDRSYGDKPTARIGARTPSAYPGGPYRSLLRFDLAAVPDGATVASATLELYVYDYEGSNSFQLYRATTNWDETVTWNTQPAYDAAKLWGSFASSAGRQYVKRTIDVTELVQKWQDGTYANYGFYIKGSTESNWTRQWFYTSDGSDAAMHPKLVINVTSGSVTSFAYDAGGSRVKTVKPDGTVTYTPFPNYEETVAGANTSTRATYSLAGQAVAIRVSGDPGGSNGLFYLHADHLGSTTALSDASGNLVGDVTRYLPFGGYRGSSAPNPLTDRAYTGQRENMADLGLYYYGARFYAPGLARFLSADTIVPAPTSPQSLNRYTYVLNQPLNGTDPDGHCYPLCTVIGGAIIGGIVGYGSQVVDNLQTGMTFSDALTTNIDPGKIVAGTFAGGLVGSGVGIVAGAVSTGAGVAATGAVAGATISEAVCGDGDCTNEVSAITTAICNDGDCTNEARSALESAPNFVSRFRTFEHYTKHVKGLIELNGNWISKSGGADMPEFQSFDAYQNAARNFMAGPNPGEGVAQIVRSNGDVVRFNPQTGYFGVKSAENVIRTFFRPDGTLEQQWKYFLDQGW